MRSKSTRWHGRRWQNLEAESFGGFHHARDILLLLLFRRADLFKETQGRDPVDEPTRRLAKIPARARSFD